jgi:broad specificity phosphatase PhoE
MIFLVRHGETEWNRKRIIQGKKNNISLNKKGIRQANKLAAYFNTKHIDYIISSPLKRALQTALIIAQRKNLEVIVDNGLSEIDYGRWSGKKSTEVSELFKSEWEKFINEPQKFAFPEGESMMHFYKRVVKSFKAIPADKDVLIVTHVNPIRMIFKHILNIEFKNIYSIHIENCTISGIKNKNSRWEVDFLNCRI